MTDAVYANGDTVTYANGDIASFGASPVPHVDTNDRVVALDRLNQLPAGAKPTGAVEIDLAHPAVIPVDRPIIAGFLNHSDLSNNSPLGIVGSPSGAAGFTSFNGTADALTFDGTRNPTTAYGGRYTLIADVLFNTAGTTVRIFSSSTAANYTGVVCYKASTDEFKIIMGDNTGTGLPNARILTCDTTTLLADTRYIIVMSVISSTSAIAYINGVKQTVSATGSSASINYQGASPASLGRWYQGGSYAYGEVDINSFFLLNGSLPESQVRELSIDPYQILKPSVPQTQIITTAPTADDRVWLL